MRLMARFVVDMLPLDEAGRRAVDETFADWSHEASQANSTDRRTLAAIRNTGGLVLVLGMLTIRDLGRWQTSRVAGSTMWVAAVITLSLVGWPIVDYAGELSSRDVPLFATIGLLAMLLPQALAVSMPLSLLTPPASRAGNRSMLGVCLLLAVVSFVNLGWATPNANQHFREAAFTMLNPVATPATRPPTLPTRGIAEYTATDLVRDASLGGAPGRRAVQALNTRVMLLAMIPICLLIGGQARRLVHALRRKRGAGLLAWGVVFAGYTLSTSGAGAVYEVLVRWQQLELWHALVTYRPLLTPLVCLLGAVALAWGAERAERGSGAVVRPA